MSGRIAMTYDAVRRESRRPVVGVRGGIVILEVAGDAVRRRPFVLPARVAFGTGGREVPTLEGEVRVTGHSALPRPLARMTGDAVGGEARQNVVRFLGAPVILFMTGHAGRKNRLEIFAVAFGTVQGLVDPLQMEPGYGKVVPLVRRHVLPGRRSVAVLAVGAELEPIAVILPPVPVAGFADRRRPLEDALDVAFGAGDRPVMADEGEIGPVMGLDRPFPDVGSGLGRRLLLPCSPSPPGQSQKEEPAKTAVPAAGVNLFDAFMMFLIFGRPA